MQKTFTFLSIFTFLSLIGSVSVLSQTDRGAGVRPAGSQTSEKRLALVIGNGAYQNASSLANPVNDATDMAATLKSLGFEVISGMNQTRVQMRVLIRQFGEKLAQQKGVGLFYYAGHGIQAAGRNYLIPVEAEIASEFEVEDAALDVNSVLRQMDGASNGFNIVILDACRNNPFARGWKRDVNSGGLAQISAPNGTLIAYATAPDAMASDGSGGRNGLYTSALLEQMRRPNVDLLRMFQNTRTEVKQKSGGRQIPWESNSTTGEFYFVGGSNVNSPNVLPNTNDPTTIELKYWEAIKSSINPEDFKAYLKKYPYGDFADLARNKISAIEAAAFVPDKLCGHSIGREIYRKWVQLGGTTSFLGCPSKNEDEASRSPQGTTGRYIEFAGTGALHLHLTGRYSGKVFELHGRIFTFYQNQGGSGSWLGFPISDEYPIPGGSRNDFEGGYVTRINDSVKAFRY